MIRNRTVSRVLNHFFKEGQNNGRIDDASLLLPARKAIFDLQRFSNGSYLESDIVELVKIRGSQINGCAFCLNMHTRDSLKAGIPAEQIATLFAWRETDWFTPRQRAALAWTEAVTLIGPGGISDEFYDECLTVFSEQEMIDLTVAVIAINSWNRLSVAFRTQPDPFSLNGAQ